MPLLKIAKFSFAAIASVVLTACGGGDGNLMDRVHIGAVVDFLDFHWRSIHWPAFNLADVFIVCATLTWCLFSLRAPIRKTPEEPRS